MMNGLCMTSKARMSDEMWNGYVSHLEKRNREEKEKLEQEKENLLSYKDSLIQDILKRTNRFSLEELKRNSLRTLERIFDCV